MASLSATVRPSSRRRVDDPVALRLDRLDLAEQRRRVGQRRPGGGLGQRRQVVGQPDQLHRVDHRAGRPPGSRAGRRRSANALLIVRVTTSRGKRGQQRHRAAACPAGRTRRTPRRRSPCPGASAATASITSRSSAVPVGLFGEQRNTTSGWNTRTCALALLGGELEVRVAVPVQPAGAGARGEQRVHRVRRREAHRGTAGPAERLQQLLLDLVGAVGRPDVGRRSARGPR